MQPARNGHAAAALCRSAYFLVGHARRVSSAESLLAPRKSAQTCHTTLLRPAERKTARLDDMLRPSQIGQSTYCVPANPLAMQSCLDPT